MRTRRRIVRPLLWGAALLLAAGCALGPRALERSHGRFGDAVQRVNQEELLRNIVRVRYNESPLSLNVSSIAAQYELAGQADARPFFSTEADAGIFRAFSTILPSVSLSGSSRPTFTLDPADDSEAVRQFLTPINGETMIFLTETRWPVSTLVRLWVERINGVPNACPVAGLAHGGDHDNARYLRIAELLEVCQEKEIATLGSADKLVELSGPLPNETITAAAVVEAAKNKFEYRPNQDGKTWTLFRRDRRQFLAVNPGAENSPELVELLELLHMKPGVKKYDVAVTGAVLPDPARFSVAPTSEFFLTTRSTAQVYFHLANGVEVPCEHVTGGTAPDCFAGPEITDGLFHVHSCRGKHPPECAYVAIRYRDHWFYIDDRDHVSKATFMLVQQLSRLDFKHVHGLAGPSLTLPVGK